MIEILKKCEVSKNISENILSPLISNKLIVGAKGVASFNKENDYCLKTLTKKNILYFLLKENNIVYIGKSINISDRLKLHEKDKNFDSIILVLFDLHEDLLFSEKNCIKSLNPNLNKNCKDEIFKIKSYVLLKDLPNCKKGSLLKQNINGDFSILDYVFSTKDIENNTDFFLELNV